MSETPTVALLRGINVGGRRRVPMTELRDALTAAGFVDVRTYVQSGNVVFDRAPAGSGGTDPDPAAVIREVVSATFGLDIEVVCRSLHELTELLGTNPFLDDEDDHAKLHVMFLDEAPDPERVAALDPDRSPGDRFAVIGRHVHVHYPDGAGRTKLTGDYVERTLQRTATARNWRTVLKLVEMLGS